MAKFSLKETISNLLKPFIPVSRRTIFDIRALPRSQSSTYDVDRVHQVIEAAQGGDVEGLFALYNDIITSGSHLQGRMVDRKEAVLSDTLNILPFDKTKPEDIETAEAVKMMIAECEDWEKICAHLLDSFLWPVSLVEKTYKPSEIPELDYQLAGMTAVPYTLLTYINGKLEIRGTDPVTGFPNAERFEADPNRYIVHRGHLLTAVPDNWGGPMRSLVFWWLLGHMDRDWWARFLDRYGAPFVVGKYDQSDDASRSILERAFSYATKLGGLVVSKETDVEIKQAAASDSGDAYKQFIELCNREISKLILGETLSSDAQATGMNSGNNKAHGAKRDEKRAGDARRLGATLRNGLFKQFLQINGFAGQAPVAVWGSVSPDEIAALCSTLDSLTSAGLEVADEGLALISEKTGLPIQRSTRAPTPVPGQVLPFSSSLKKKGDETVDVIAEAAAGDLAKAFRGELAPIRAIILRSASREEAMRDVLAFCAKFEPGKAARIAEDAFVAMAANGAVADAVG